MAFRTGESGTVMVIQHFGSALNLNVHFHVLAVDGVYAAVADPESGGAGIEFHGLPPPETEEVAELLKEVSRRILRLVVRLGRLRETEDGYVMVPREEWERSQSDSALGPCQAASVRGRIALGPRAGGKVRRQGDLVQAEWEGDGSAGLSRPRCAEESGFSLHADVWVDGHDRERLERLCRYIARPAIATERLKECEDGRIAYELRRAWRDGTTAMLFEPGELIASALVRKDPGLLTERDPPGGASGFSGPAGRG